MPLTHNQINCLWYKADYVSFKNSPFIKKIFTKTDLNDFLKTGAYLIKEAKKLSEILIPWDNSKKYEILNNPRLENAFMSLGAEYLLKGVFLNKGYAINKLKPNIKTEHPLFVSRNKRKLNPIEVVELDYIVNNMCKFLDFSEFNNKQTKTEKEEKAKLKGHKLWNITRMTIPYPTARQLLKYMQFKRNFALHRPLIMPEFKGLTNQLYDILEYISLKEFNKSINELADL